MDISHKNAGPRAAKHFPPLSLKARPAVPTVQAAYYLHRKPQTLRKKWAVYDGSSPVRPLRCNGRQRCPLDQIRAALGVTSKVEFA